MLQANTELLAIDFELPLLQADPYHRPYVAAWIETPDRTPVVALLLWADDEEWHKDLRQWWRKVGRYGRDEVDEVDAITGATRRPGDYQLSWDGKDRSGHAVVPGEYVVHLEAAREEGGRSHVRQSITLGEAGQYAIEPEGEFGGIRILVNAAGVEK